MQNGSVLLIESPASREDRMLYFSQINEEIVAKTESIIAQK